ncbi:phosphotransferase [Nocardioides sp. J9]|uniref:phosphotransferase n=1 Tax=Nocardioides sp. J9 TaxID=935844 RepID=UPI001C96815D|nr:phosphotransferase [Nocardioides sp. J9]
MAPTAEQQAARLRGVLGAEVAPHDRGGESRTFRTGDGALVTVGLDWPQVRREPCDVERECGLLAAVARVVAVAVPEVVDRVPDEGLVVVRDALDSRQQAEAAAFLARPAPEPTDDLCFTHNDLGVEHVLVDPASRRVTGVIDWSDAAVTDPSVDLARLLRDLGPDALDHAVRVYRQHGGDPAPLLPRVGFYAVCGLVEDLTFGLLEARPAYVDKSLRLWDAVVGPVLAGG